MGRTFAIGVLSKVIYYFVTRHGTAIETEDMPRGYFDARTEPDMFTQKKLAVAEQKRRLKARINELQTILKELK